MSKINITQADLIAKESQEDKIKRAGISNVEIVPNDKCKTRGNGAIPKTVQLKGWQRECASAMMTFFDVKSYSTRRGSSGRKLPSVVWSFYGIAENTTAAAYAFEMVSQITKSPTAGP